MQGQNPKRNLQMTNIQFNPTQQFPPVAGSSPINYDRSEVTGYSAQVLKAHQSVGKRATNKTTTDGQYHSNLSGTHTDVLKTIDINHILDQQQRVDGTLRQYKTNSTSSKQSMGIGSGTLSQTSQQKKFIN
jgi:hypothetical protein